MQHVLLTSHSCYFVAFNYNLTNKIWVIFTHDFKKCFGLLVAFRLWLFNLLFNLLNDTQLNACGTCSLLPNMLRKLLLET